MNNENNSFKTVSNFEKKKPSFFKNFLTVILVLLVFAIIFVVLFKVQIFPSTNNTITSEKTNENTIVQAPNTSTFSLEEYSKTSISVAEKVKPSIVGITVEFSVNSIFGRTSSASAEGSGILISEDGYILTNNHIISSASSNSSFYQVSEANKILVYLNEDKTPYEAKIIGSDKETDLAVIKIEKTGLVAAELGDSDKILVGEFAMAVGNPLGLQSTVTAGIISAINREVTDNDGKKYVLIQTDAAINSGNSGGALVNSKGQVIGINTLKLAGSGIEGMGFAIPINSTKDIYTTLISDGKIKRPFIGIEGIDVTEDLAEYNKIPIGVYVKDVLDFSSAQKSGIKIGDVITKINGKEIKTVDELNEIKNTNKIGDTVELTIFRDNETTTISLTLYEQP